MLLHGSLEVWITYYKLSDYFSLTKPSYNRKILILLFDFFFNSFTMISKKNDLIKLLVPFKFWNQMYFNEVYKYMYMIMDCASRYFCV